ncbi:MAG: hypothetical protein A2878_01195 [Candidatus Moranbacteria bacterium RIFCSPHIGHO2_01_FULL_54_31]|nr:MAG: hypothetical protein A2878_01195 [Candidatus Moranbacteria bacterium RIFCSPHIGHO2_01_FULL_54_31]
MTVPIALYLNLENTLIPRTTFPKLMSNGKEGYSAALRTMDSRISLVAPAKDWAMLTIANPELIDFLNRRGINILPTLFSHVLPDLFPETIKMQFTLASTTLKKLFEKISWHGIIPENAVSSIVVNQATEHWESVVLSIGHNNSRGLHTGHYQLTGAADSAIPIQIIANAPARLRYMQMYREKAGVSAVLESMEGSELVNSCLFDFERPWSNVIYYPHSGKGSARLDIWKQFHRRLASKSVLPWGFQDGPSRANLFLDTAELSLWKNNESHWLIDIQRDAVTQCLGRGDYFELASLVASSCMPPRVLTRFMQDDSFPSTQGGKVGVVDLVGDVSKVKEVLLLCKNISQKRRVDYGVEFLPKGERLYLELLHKTLLWYDQYIL